MTNSRAVFSIWLAMLIVVVLGFVLSCLVILTPFEVQGSFFDSLAADGDLESYTIKLYQFSWNVAIVIGIFCLLVFIFMIIFRNSARSLIGRFLLVATDIYKRVKLDTSSFMKMLIPGRADLFPLGGLLFITVFGAILRYAYLWRPMTHDETYTFVGFAARGLRVVVTDYHLPNNHVLHTILVNLFYQLFGDSPAVVRLPAFIAGILIIPATYMVGRIFYNSKIGLLSASIICVLPIMIDYSTVARGYTMLALFALLIISIAAYIKDHLNLIAWGVLVLLSGLGLYTNPTMIYPIGMAFTWLLLSNLAGDKNELYGNRFYLYLAGSVIGIVFLAAFLYTPIIFTSGISSLLGNEVIESLSWSEFIQSLVPRINNTWQEWNRSLPNFISWLGLIGLAASFFVPKLPRNRRIPLVLAGFLWIFTALVIQRVAPWPRIWLFLLPFFVIWITAGYVGLFTSVTRKFSINDKYGKIVIISLILLLLSTGFYMNSSQLTQKRFSTGEVENVALFLRDTLTESDQIAVISPDRIILEYYLLRNDISNDVFEEKGDYQDFQVIVVVNQGMNQEMLNILDRRDLLEKVDLDTVEQIYQSRRFILYQLSSN